MSNSGRADDATKLRRAIATLLQVFKVEDALSGDGPYARMNLSDLSVVLFLGDAGAPMTMGAVAAYLEARLSTAGTIVERLVKAELVKRERVEHDRRIVEISLTAAGTELYQETVEAQVRHCRSMLDALETADERKQLVALLDKVAGAAAAIRTRSAIDG